MGASFIVPFIVNSLVGSAVMTIKANGGHVDSNIGQIASQSIINKIVPCKNPVIINDRMSNNLINNIKYTENKVDISKSENNSPSNDIKHVEPTKEENIKIIIKDDIKTTL